jgi:hypothetical protein
MFRNSLHLSMKKEKRWNEKQAIYCNNKKKGKTIPVMGREGP